MSQIRYRINNGIKISPVVVIDDKGNNLGAMPLNKAKNMAFYKKLDLVEVAPSARPPVCKILDYNKFKYEQEIKSKKQKVKNVIKEVRLSCGITDHDMETKANHVIKFLKNNYKVNIKLEFKRRENNHKDIGKEVVDNFIKKIQEHSVIVKNPTLDGRFIFCSVESKKQ